MYYDFFEESVMEAKRMMDDYTNQEVRKHMCIRVLDRYDNKEDVSYLDGKFPKDVIKGDDEPVYLHRTPPAFINRLLSRISKKAAINIKRFRDYEILNDDTKVGEIDINIDDKDTVNIVWLGINDKYQGNGYAQAVFRIIIPEIKANGFTRVTLEVPGISPNARHIYEKIGFKAGKQISDDDDMWGGLTAMTLDIEDYISPEKKDIEITEAAEDESPNDDGGKAGVYKLNYYMRDNLQSVYVTPKLSKPRIQDSLIEFTGKFIDDHSEQLSTSGPVHMIKFGENETSFLYNLFGVNGDELIEIFNKMIAETYYGKISKFIVGWVTNAPHKLLITAILIDAIQNNYEDMITCCEYLWAFCEYPILYRLYFKTGVKEDVMNYTVEHLGSKFKVKKVNNLQGLLKWDAHSAVESHKERLIGGADHVYADFMQRMRNQINNTIKNIARAYYDNDKNNATLHDKSIQFDDGSMSDQEGHTTNIAQVVTSTVNKFANGSVNPGMVRACADGANVDKGNLTGYLNQIMGTKENKLYRFIEDVITIYFTKNPASTSVGDGAFASFGLKLYRSIGTSKDPMYQEVRQILDTWMFEIINIRQYYQHEGTIINYTRGIFNYFIFMISYYNN